MSRNARTVMRHDLDVLLSVTRVSLRARCACGWLGEERPLKGDFVLDAVEDDQIEHLMAVLYDEDTQEG